MKVEIDIQTERVIIAYFKPHRSTPAYIKIWYRPTPEGCYIHWQKIEFGLLYSYDMRRYKK